MVDQVFTTHSHLLNDFEGDALKITVGKGQKACNSIPSFPIINFFFSFPSQGQNLQI